MSDKFPVQMSYQDLDKILAYCRHAKPSEIIGLAHAKLEKGVLMVYDPIILPQKVSGAECEIEPKELAKFIGAYDRIADIRCVWHSHVEMTAYFSACDRNTSTTLAALGKMVQGASSWFFSLVINCRGEYEAKIDVFHPIPYTVQCELKTNERPVSPEDEAIKKEVAEKCNRPTYHQSNFGNMGNYPYGVRSPEGDEGVDTSQIGKFSGWMIDDLVNDLIKE